MKDSDVSMYSTIPGPTDPQKKEAGMARPLLPQLCLTSQDNAESCSVIVIVPVAIAIAVVSVLLDLMGVDGNATAVATANSRAHRRGVAARADYCNRRDLRDEDEIVLGVSRDRVRAGTLWDGLDQEIGFRVDHAEHSAAGLPVGTRVVAPIALVEPHLVRSDNATAVNGVSLAHRLDDQRARVAGAVGRGSAQ